MVRGSAGTSSSSGKSSSIRCLCVGATYCRTLACYTYIADLFAQGLDLSGRTRNLHNVLVGVPAAMHSDGSFRHANVIAKIASNSMQIFALSQFPGDTGDLPARIPYYICDTDIATERCGNRELGQNVESTSGVQIGRPVSRPYTVSRIPGDRPPPGQLGKLPVQSPVPRFCVELRAILLLVLVAIPTRFSLVVAPCFPWRPSSTGTLDFFFCPRVTILVSMFVALVPVLPFGERDPRRPLFSNNLLVDGVTGAARVTSLTGRRRCFKAGVVFLHMAAATRLTLNLLPTASNFFSRLKYFPEGKHRPFLNVVQYQADPRQMVVQARYQIDGVPSCCILSYAPIALIACWVLFTHSSWKNHLAFYIFSICKFMHPMNVQKGSRLINDCRKNDVLSVFNATLGLYSYFVDFDVLDMKTILEIFFYVFRLLVCFRLQHSLELILIRASHLSSRQLKNGRKQIFSVFKDKREKATTTY
ncbi:hypothetical protein T10_2329 [Trichinella papuae]|uniref:Uncharacterized protein n=1 Tax=Trichinella papuae TaxID=268474 RepID=A0A0V1M4D4_9BILA|nr:hypothetical protein T10_2329 [Trichinella papuae]